MIKRINEAFTQEEHEALKKKKEECRIQRLADKLTWHDFILIKAGVKKE